MCPLLVLVVEVDGTVGQVPLTCIESPEEIIRRGNQSQDIFWKMNGVDQAQTGNSYLVQLEESLGGGNYSCHDKDGSLLNHTVVLIREDQTDKRKILVKTDQGMDVFKALHSLSYNCQFLETFMSMHTAELLLFMWLLSLDYLKCSAQNYNGEFHCSWTWHSSRVGKVAFIKAQR